MKTYTSIKSFATIFVLFALVMAIKDLLIKGLLIKGLSLFVILTISGLTSCAISASIGLFSGASFRPKDARSQFLRLFTSCAAWGMAIASYSWLSATSVSVFAKISIPLFIILSPVFGEVYQLKQKIMAASSLLMLLAFVGISINSGEPFFGFAFVGLAVFFVMVETLMLRHSAKNENPMMVSLVPSSACVLVGVIGQLSQNGEIKLAFDSGLVVAMIGLGCVISAYYALSIRRFKLLPLGASEYPALIAIFFVMAGEYFFWDRQVGLPYSVTITGVSILLAGTIYTKNVKSSKIVH